MDPAAPVVGGLMVLRTFAGGAASENPSCSKCGAKDRAGSFTLEPGTETKPGRQFYTCCECQVAELEGREIPAPAPATPARPRRSPPKPTATGPAASAAEALDSLKSMGRKGGNS